MITARPDLDASREDSSLTPDKSGGDAGEVLVTVSFAVSRQEPWQAKLPAKTHMSAVRESAMKYFGVVDHVDSAGNGIRHQLVRRGTRLRISMPRLGISRTTGGRWCSASRRCMWRDEHSTRGALSRRGSPAGPRSRNRCRLVHRSQLPDHDRGRDGLSDRRRTLQPAVGLARVSGAASVDCVL